MTNRFLLIVAAGVLLSGISPLSVSSHDGKLDAYGCHYDEERKNYHCHEGAFKGGSFESKIEMIRQLKLQFLNLGRPWPYDDIAEEDITTRQSPNN
jgi:hypothetical protein